MDDSIDSTAQMENTEEESVPSPEVVDNSQNEVEQRLRNELEKERERARKREEELMKQLEEERREKEACLERIDELTAKVAQYEKNKTLVDRLVTDAGIKAVVDTLITNTGIPEDSFPEAIDARSVALALSQFQSAPTPKTPSTTHSRGNSSEDKSGDAFPLDQLSTIPTFTTHFESAPKEEPVDFCQSITGEMEVESLKEEINDEPIDTPLLDQPLGLDFIGDEIKEEETLNEDLEFSQNFIDEFKDEPIPEEDMDSPETAEKRKRRRSSLKCTESANESDEEVEPTVKRGISESVERGDEVVPQKSTSTAEGTFHSNSVKEDKDDLKENEEEHPQCVLCDASSSTITGYMGHLHKVHNKTTLHANGIFLQCTCGFIARHYHKIASQAHADKCKARGFSVHKCEEKPIPQCVYASCNVAFRPTIYSYIEHLKVHHKSTLNENGIYLKCACGHKVTRWIVSRQPTAHKNCTESEFTLHKLDED